MNFVLICFDRVWPNSTPFLEALDSFVVMFQSFSRFFLFCIYITLPIFSQFYFCHSHSYFAKLIYTYFFPFYFCQSDTFCNLYLPNYHTFFSVLLLSVTHILQKRLIILHLAKAMASQTIFWPACAMHSLAIVITNFRSFFLFLRLLLLTHFGESPMCEIIFHPIFWHN